MPWPSSTPSRLLQYLEFPEIREALAKCKVIMAGGEGYPSSLYEKLRNITDSTLINTYGPTEISVSSNGKIDRKALPPASLMQQQDYVAPTNQAEEDYCQIFAQILSLEKVGIDDHFFELGGSSLLVTQITLEASKRGQQKRL